MWSRIASIVDDLNFYDDDGSDDSSFSNEEKEQSRIDMELKSTQEELAKYYYLITSSIDIKKR